MTQRVEYRVRWKREGRRETTRIYQRWDSAYRKAQGVLALEAVKERTSFDTLPDLEERPTIESRPVGDWLATDVQVEPPGESAQDAMEQWAEFSRPRYTSPEGAPF